MTVQDYELEPFGVRLRRLRKERGLSQQQLAEAAGINLAFVSRLETGSRFPSHETNVALAHALGVEERYLREGEGRWTGLVVDAKAPRGLRLIMVSAATAEEAFEKVHAHGIEPAYLLPGLHEPVHP